MHTGRTRCLVWPPSSTSLLPCILLFIFSFSLNLVVSLSSAQVICPNFKYCVPPTSGFYSYSAFVKAAATFPDFASTGDAVRDKRELAAFLGQISHETTGKNLNP